MPSKNKKEVIPTQTNAALQIRDVAQTMFLEKSFDSITVRDIAQAAGVTPGLVLYHYGSKENLAKIVYNSLREELYAFLEDQIDFSSLPSGERLYVLSVCLWKYIDETKNYSMFFHSLLINTHIADEPSEAFRKLARNTIEEYNLTVSEHENDIYLTALIGSEKLLISHSYFNNSNITYFEIANLLISNYLFNIGLENTEIKKIVNNGSAFLKSTTLVAKDF